MDNPPSDKSDLSSPDFARESLLQALDRIILNLDFITAVKAADWQAADRLLAQGVDLSWREQSGLKALLLDGGMEAVKIFEKGNRKLDSNYPFLPLVMAAEKGDREVADYMLSRNPPAAILNRALFYALRGGHDDIAESLLARLTPKTLSEEGLQGILLWRTAEYQRYLDAVPAEQEECRGLVFSLLQYANACQLKNGPAMEAALRNLAPVAALLHSQSLLQFQITGYNAFINAVPFVMASGNAEQAEEFTALFLKAGAPNSVFLREVATTGDEGLISRIFALAKPDARDIRDVMLNCCFDGKMAALRFLVKTYPEVAKDNNASFVLGAFAIAGKAEDFFMAVDLGIVPQEKQETDFVIVRAAEHENQEIVRYLLQLRPPDGVTAQLLRDEETLPCLRLAAALSGDIRAEDDLLFWRAVEANDDATQDLFKGVTRISTQSSQKVKAALDAAALRGDIPLLRRIARQAEWDKGSREHFFNALLLLPAGPIHDPAFSAFLPSAGALETEQISRATGGKGRSGDDAVQNIECLKGKGFVLSHHDVTHALRTAVNENRHALADYLLGEYFTRLGERNAEKTPDDHAWPSFTLERNIDRETARLLAKWTARQRFGTETKAEIDFAVAACADDALFSGPDSPAFRAARSGHFSVVLDRMEKSGLTDPSLLTGPQDAYGNGLLDILGAQGRLGDILRPSLWRAQDALSFARAHIHPSYYGQMDFQRLEAALDRMRLKEKSKKFRPSLKKGGRP